MCWDGFVKHVVGLDTSRANLIEAHFGPLRQFPIASFSHCSPHRLALRAYLRWRNANARHPDIPTAQRRNEPASVVRSASEGAA
ncbi:hypothetical protein GCM10009661_56630 [Catellatospora chokoriensis]|uniref:Transposase n=1 Tax=Catellatospora chokoriensis TaxID=310353 RepID=A0A8J3JSX5_9ACTN|nr:hypothetical protein Cch02nite_39300 [Catellatospora chokoriensis]